ncbi:MAG: RpiB/LacA/LacB family sugar-phosphate isomerase [Bdellovibrionales bacterium]|nr:RpiB/LacA/LacB family sugar-phosphate isomerase [Bdellovibrionales bacterium]
MKLFIASDHAGFDLKAALLKRAAELKVTLTDLGPTSDASVDYPDYADLLSKTLVDHESKSGSTDTLGVLICGSGVGVSIAANRHPGIRAVLAESPEVARLGREHNHANVLCLGSRIVSTDKAVEILKSFLQANPDPGERHLRRIEKLGKKPG